MDKNKILEKLRKLMNLKESALALGNEGEACAAAAGITRLLIAYNLSETDIPTQERIENPVVAEEIPFKPEVCSGNWYKNLVSIVCSYNMCRSLIVSTMKDNGRMSRDKFQIVGRKKNVEVALYLISFLANKFYHIGRKEYPSYRHDCLFKYGRSPQSLVMYLRSFLFGCVSGLEDKFRTEKEQLQSECDITALTISAKAEIDDFMKDQKIGKARASKQSVDRLSAIRGYEAGNNVEIHKGIYAESVCEDRRLM